MLSMTKAKNLSKALIVVHTCLVSAEVREYRKSRTGSVVGIGEIALDGYDEHPKKFKHKRNLMQREQKLCPHGVETGLTSAR